MYTHQHMFASLVKTESLNHSEAGSRRHQQCCGTPHQPDTVPDPRDTRPRLGRGRDTLYDVVRSCVWCRIGDRAGKVWIGQGS